MPLNLDDKRRATGCQLDAQACASNARRFLALGDCETASYWQDRAQFYGRMARYFLIGREPN